MRHKKGCDCLFCQARCPECGSKAVEIQVSPVYSFTVGEPDKIEFKLIGIQDITITHKPCGDFDDDFFFTDDKDNLVNPYPKAEAMLRMFESVADSIIVERNPETGKLKFRTRKAKTLKPIEKNKECGAYMFPEREEETEKG